jgi:voltage-gated potassium channel Kch
MKASTEDRHSLFLLLSLVFFLVLVHPLDEYGGIGEPVVLVLFSMILIATAFELSDQQALRRVAVALVACVILVHLGVHFYPTMLPLVIASHVLSIVFFGFTSVVMFAYLGRPGVITRGRLYASVSLYLILGIFWFSVYRLIETIHAGSFVLMGPHATSANRATLLYFSLITLTTVGYGDVLPATPTARGLAALEGVSGVLYLAITVARLVAAYQSLSNEGVK